MAVRGDAGGLAEGLCPCPSHCWAGLPCLMSGLSQQEHGGLPQPQMRGSQPDLQFRGGRLGTGTTGAFKTPTPPSPVR